MEMAKMENNEIKNSKLIPRLRFPGFEGEWEEKKLGELADRINRRNRQLEVSRVLTNSATDGVVDQSDYFERDIAVKGNTDNYHIVEIEDFVYNPRISSSAPVGPISVNKVGRGIMSPLYTIFRFHCGCTPFFEQYFRTNIWHPYLKSIANFGARFDRMNITTEGFFDMPLLILTLPEQQKIASCLSELDNLIAAQGQKVDALKEKKKGLMQQLFPQQGETTPRLRFPGFEGEWNAKTIGEVADVLQGFGFPDKYQGQTSGELPFCKVGDISAAVDRGEQTIYKAANYVDYSMLPTLHGKPIPVGATVFAKIGEAIRSNKRIKTAVPCLIDNNVAAVKARDSITDDFLFYVMSQINLADYAGGIVPSVNKSVIEAIQILLTPIIPEQQKIASCLSELDNLIAAQGQMVDALKDHKKGLMQQLFPQPTK